MSNDSPRPDAVIHSLLLPAAEMGLLYRPIHLLVGTLPWSECLSPYTRDLTITLEQFAQRRAQLGKPVENTDPSTYRYAIAEAFVQGSADRLHEKIGMESGVGILRLYQEYAGCLWIDSKRIDWESTDSEVAHLRSHLTKPYPVWCILNPEDFTEFEKVLEIFCQKVSRQLASCTISGGLSVEICERLSAAGVFINLPDHRNPYQHAAQTLVESVSAPTPAAPPPEPQKKASGPLHRIKA